MDLAGKKVLVLGLGVSGHSASHFLLSKGAIVWGADQKINRLSSDPSIQHLVQKGLRLLVDQLPLPSVDFIVVSPGIPLSHPLVQAAYEAKIAVIGEIELGALFSRHSMMGVTGTNGKTTVTLMTTHILNQCGYPATSLGNTGIPFTRELLTLPETNQIILELSSYQLETLSQPVLNVGIILNITPDHLDRYPSMEAYVGAKIQIEKCLKSTGTLYVDEKTFRDYQSLFKNGTPLVFGYHLKSFIYSDLLSVYRAGHKKFDLPPSLQGRKTHDLENLLACYALCAEQGISADQFLEGWASFKKPDHRIQLIADFNQVHYYDDSKGTNIDAVVRAVQSIDRKIILIAGGVDKGASYLPWLEAFKDKVKYICVIGEAAVKIESELSPYIGVLRCSTLEEAVTEASRNAEPGEAVLLSPGCASFDMFTDYVHRGKEFQRVVKNSSKSYLIKEGK